MSSSSPFDASIPVLTEVIDTQALLHQQDEAAPVDPVIAPAPVAAPWHDHPPAQPGSAGVDESPLHAAAAVPPAGEAPTDWAALEQRLCERILQQLQGQVGFLIEQRIRDSMADALQQALASLSGQLADGLNGALERIVTRAVSEELLHLRQK